LTSSFFWDVTQRRLVFKLPTFQENLSIPSSRIKQSKNMGLTGFPETSVTANLRCLTSQKNEDFLYAEIEA
jgi:hypothetical protein